MKKLIFFFFSFNLANNRQIMSQNSQYRHDVAMAKWFRVAQLQRFSCDTAQSATHHSEMYWILVNSVVCHTLIELLTIQIS